MRLDIKKLTIATAAVWAVWYSICSFFVAVAPTRIAAVLSYVLHYDLTGSRPITLGSYCIGLMATTLWVAGFAAAIGWVFNTLGSTTQRRGAGRPEKARTLAA